MRLRLTSVAAVPAFVALAACSTTGQPPTQPGRSAPPAISGRVSVVDGRTLYFPGHGRTVQLVNINTCNLAQWAVIPPASRADKPAPIPCGAKAKAWLARSIGTNKVQCSPAGYTAQGQFLAYCTVKEKDLALEMLRVGLAVIDTPNPLRPEYFSVQADAVVKEYGIWSTFVLDMDEWRRRAVDQTPARQPIADYNLLADRGRDLTPPMIRRRNRPNTTSL